VKQSNPIFRKLTPPVVVLLCAIAAMDLTARMLAEPFILPRPGQVARAMVTHRAELLASLATTSEAALIGFAASALFGTLAAIVLSGSSIIRRAFYPYTVFFQTVPIVAIAPLLMIWCGPGLLPVALCAFIVSVFPVIASGLTGLLSTEPALEDLFTLYGSDGLSRLLKLKLPAALPDIFTGLRVAAGLAVIGTVVAEFLVGVFGAGEGLGVRIVAAKKQGRTDEVFAAVLIASLLGLAMFAGINAASRLMLRRWHASEQS
jgi:NitT/TauT family transport system permease protein